MKEVIGHDIGWRQPGADDSTLGGYSLKGLPRADPCSHLVLYLYGDYYSWSRQSFMIATMCPGAASAMKNGMKKIEGKDK